MASDDTLYCLCRLPYDADRFMIECDVCKDWFHGSCVDVQEIQAGDIEVFHCPKCVLINGPLVLKKRRNWHRHDYSELDDGIGKRLPIQKVQSGTAVFVQNLKNRVFPSADDVTVRLQGYQVRKQYLEQHGFEWPIIVDRLDGLGLTVPPPTFSILDVERYVGSMREIDVIDVSRQEDYKMLMREWTEYYNSPTRTKVFNVISLEFSKTKLAEVVAPPELVREVSWASRLWQDDVPDDAEYEKPQVQRYCLMGVKDSFTDFHIDFGGTSVWYHILKGEKVFYLVAPTARNLEFYEKWVDSVNQSESFFGDKVDRCYRMVVKQGNTIFIPSGWIHAVLTPIDSLVFGGNFLHDYAVDMQIHVYGIERNVKTPEKYLFPNFETAHWYAAKYFYDYLNDCNEENREINSRMLNSAKSITAALKSWTHKKDLTGKSLYIKRDGIPNNIQHGKLLKDMAKVIKLTMLRTSTKLKAEAKAEAKFLADAKAEAKAVLKAEEKAEKNAKITPRKNPEVKAGKDPEVKGKRKKKKDIPAKAIALQELEQLQTQIQEVTEIGVPKPKKGTGGKATKGKPKTCDVAVPRLKMRIPKATSSLDTSVYDFDDFGDDDLQKTGKEKKGASGTPPQSMRSPQAKLKGGHLDSPLKSESESTMSSPMSSPGALPMTSPWMAGPMTAAELEAHVAGLKASSALKLKLLNGKLVSGKKAQPAKFQLLAAAKQLEMGPDSDEDDEGPGLVVDENPTKPKKRPKTTPPKKAAPQTVSAAAVAAHLAAASTVPLKLKLPIPGIKTEQMFGIAGGTAANPEEVFTQLKEMQTMQDLKDILPEGVLPDGLELGGDTDDLMVDRMNMPTIRGGLNGSIADILEASGYGTETDFKIDDDIGRRRAASPTMRDAIQGMLSMSRMTGPSPLTMGGASPFIDTKPKTTIRLQREQREARGQKRKYTYNDDTGEGMPTCFKDDEYVYPTLDLSDNEDDHVFKPRGRQKKDETWNPKAKLEPNAPKPERPQREGTRRESVESGLAAAAARLATQPPPKRQYIRKKPRLSKPEFGGSPLDTSLAPLPGTSFERPLPTNPMPVEATTSPTQKPSTSNKTPTFTGGKKAQKKGMATAKQRLSKILGFKKMFR